jgi:hypothetical protein
LKNEEAHRANGQFMGQSPESRDRLVLTAIAGRDFRHGFALGPGFKRHSHFLGAHESPADISVFRTGIERNQLIAVLAVNLEPVADFLRPLPEYLRAFRAFDSYFVFDHEMPLNSMLAVSSPWFKDVFTGLLNPY